MDNSADRSSGIGRRARVAPPMVGRSESLNELWSVVNAVGSRDTTALIHGESGTGKELVARHLHSNSKRAAGPFVPVDCTTLRDTMLESQLFGHVRGAFTGAHQATLGFFRAADNGTLFLDEIGELPLDAQARLLRCIQERAVVPMGGVEPIPVNVRIIAATHRDLEAMVRKGTFREDLFFRLNVVQVRVPALRQRVSDIALLAEHFLHRMAELYDEPVRTLSQDAIAALEAYDWPGNVRELSNAIEHALVLCKNETLSAADLPEKVRLAGATTTPAQSHEVPSMAVAERNLIAQALRVAGGNQAKAARMLQIRRQRLYRKIRTFGLESLTSTTGE